MALPRIKDKRDVSIYTDFNISLDANPLTGDLVLLTNEKAINSALRNLLTVNKGEYLFQPDKGSTLNGMLFENRTPAVMKLIKEMVKDTIKIYEPRADVLSVDVSSEIDSHEIYIKVVYQPRTSEDPVLTEIIVERTR